MTSDIRSRITGQQTPTDGQQYPVRTQSRYLPPCSRTHARTHVFLLSTCPHFTANLLCCCKLQIQIRLISINEDARKPNTLAAHSSPFIQTEPYAQSPAYTPHVGVRTQGRPVTFPLTLFPNFFITRMYVCCAIQAASLSTIQINRNLTVCIPSAISRCNCDNLITRKIHSEMIEAKGYTTFSGLLPVQKRAVSR